MQEAEKGTHMLESGPHGLISPSPAPPLPSCVILDRPLILHVSQLPHLYSGDYSPHMVLEQCLAGRKCSIDVKYCYVSVSYHSVCVAIPMYHYA